MNYLSLSEYGLEFKNIISGPAPVGRILNYIKLTGNGILKHKNGYRNLDLSNNIGYAWTTEFMFGLGLVYSDEKEENDQVIQLKLTSNGNKLFKFISNINKINFDEENYDKCKDQVLGISYDFYNCFKEVFVNSIVYKNLQIYLKNKKNNTFSKSTFKDDYYNELYTFYTGRLGENNSEGATTGGNRVPSLISLCKFFDLAYEGRNNYYFYVEADKLYESNTAKFKLNRIVFGAPGTGKSFKLNTEKNELLKGIDVNEREKYYERVTFYPDYTYANFVGTYKPVMINSKDSINQNDKEIIEVLNDKSISAQEKYNKLYDKFKDDNSLTRLSILIGLYDGGDFVAKKTDGSDAAKSSVEKSHGKGIKPYVNLINNNNLNGIAYEYVPDPFIRLFVKAINDPEKKPYLLLIEEINRANVAAVFGDLFQLLDRNDNEESMYPVEASEDIKNFLAKEGIELNNNKIIIPNNLFIWATMNSADQGVFPMDTAFKRRWDFEYLGIDNEEEKIKNKIIKLNISNGTQYVNWNKLRKCINDHIACKKINEDKQLGPFFISDKLFKPIVNGILEDDADFKFVFKNKVLMYLFEDVFKSRPSLIFSDLYGGIYRYSSICDKFDEIGVKIFDINKIEDTFTMDENKINDIKE